MNITLVYGTERKGSTYNIAQLFLNKLRDEKSEVREIFLPRDMPHFCKGCSLCFMKGEEYCPDYEQVNKIRIALEKADMLIFASPVYVYHTTGQMKALLDNFGYQWMVHRPNKAMFGKIALVISTAAGAGMKSTNKDIADSLTFWGIARIFRYGKGVAAIDWNSVSDDKKSVIYKDVDKISSKIIKKFKNVTPSIKVKALFHAMRIAQKKGGFNKTDVEYWKEQGWLGSLRPWKS
ncbi:NAD(P)H-dependent oxidoreductase [Sedimentibacter hydroxybenzoicus DSM 7310]|uniref:NAD(P)H-dependent oxidoreductase n=1 Tax=Sedimentibacter hydroxybenzoicus DSM 7310 TaxID=1123245 RepID=A0A974BIR8_SEDHY|nr:NAD(P)H-dependent oxidoreductase [Sedimentibacter hydroxybenzoicus]NYB73601.1 NAD(P)H-dependent oxidoreductase [Sedimentibacter hydroxybenzoicus DSM 7310]